MKSGFDEEEKGKEETLVASDLERDSHRFLRMFEYVGTAGNSTSFPSHFSCH